MCLRVLKERNKSRIDSYSHQEQCIDHIPYYLSGLSLHFFPTTFLEIAVYNCMKRLRKGENICVLFENPTHCSIGTAGRRNKCREDHDSYRSSSQSRNCVFNCNDLLCIQFTRVDRTLCHHLSMCKIIIMLRHNFMQKSGV